jgi:protein-L-isoaspartate(D-aspartate) O-methyltransferase
MTLDFAAARENMVENQVRTNDVTDLAIQDAMREVRRELLCPGKLHLAYAEAPVEYAPGYYLMEPRDTAKLLQGVRPRAGERALAIAAPYAAAVMAAMGLKVTLRLPDGVEAGQGTEAGVTVAHGDLAILDESAPYDVIVVEGAVTRAPEAWTSMLADGGRLGVVERQGPVGKAKLYLHGADGVISTRTLFDATPPMLSGFEPVAAFQF